MVEFNDELTATVKELAQQLGFVRTAIAPVGEIRSAERFRRWLASGYNADMTFLEENLEKRLCPAQLVENAQSVICLAASYAPANDSKPAENEAFIARYARGRNYHKFLKIRAHKLCDILGETTAGFQGRAFVDTAPVAERALAAEAGLGWTGRSGALIVPGFGSYVVLAEIVCNLPLRPGKPLTGVGCGDCSACIAACPTRAIVSDGTVDSRRCLSYHTIENRGKIPQEFWPKLGNRTFGCESCMSICPHNRPSIIGEDELSSPEDYKHPSLAELLSWTEENWDQATRGKASRRATFAMYLRNAAIAAGNSGDKSLIEPLKTLRHRQPELSKETDWALAALNNTPDKPCCKKK